MENYCNLCIIIGELPLSYKERKGNISGSPCTVIILRSIIVALYVKQKQYTPKKRVSVFGNILASWRKLDNYFNLKVTVKHQHFWYLSGTAWGYIESFLFWLLQDLGGSRSLMGLTITVGGIAGVPLLVLSGPIISKIGHANILFIGFIFYTIRLLGK